MGRSATTATRCAVLCGDVLVGHIRPNRVQENWDYDHSTMEGNAKHMMGTGALPRCTGVTFSALRSLGGVFSFRPARSPSRRAHACSSYPLSSRYTTSSGLQCRTTTPSWPWRTNLQEHPRIHATRNRMRIEAKMEGRLPRSRRHPVDSVQDSFPQTERQSAIRFDGNKQTLLNPFSSLQVELARCGRRTRRTTAHSLFRGNPSHK